MLFKMFLPHPNRMFGSKVIVDFTSQVHGNADCKTIQNILIFKWSFLKIFWKKTYNSGTNHSNSMKFAHDL